MKLLSKILLFILLTIITQIGGLVYLLTHASYPLLNKFSNPFLRAALKPGAFLVFYAVATLFLVPVLARPFGRVPLPVMEEGNLAPLTFLTPLLNRHYVRPELRQIAQEVAGEINKKFPGTTVNYLDANFPFLNGFPLIPHFSHKDGKKLDLAFFYDDSQTGKDTNEAPSLFGYGINEEPLPGEENTAALCVKEGYWQYSFLTAIIPQSDKALFSFDRERTRALVTLLADQASVGKIFIEPHLKKRLGLSSEKIRFHGCQVVRHDDHIHLQLK